MILDDDTEKPLIDYPCEWQYKLIGEDPKKIQQRVKEQLAICLPGRHYAVTPSNQSRSKKYSSLNLVVQIENEAERDQLYTALKHDPAIKMIL